MNSPNSPGELMTAREAMVYLGISSKTMSRLLASGTLPSVPDPLDKRVKLIQRADVEALRARSTKNAA